MFPSDLLEKFNCDGLISINFSLICTSEKLVTIIKCFLWISENGLALIFPLNFIEKLNYHG